MAQPLVEDTISEKEMLSLRSPNGNILPPGLPERILTAHLLPKSLLPEFTPEKIVREDFGQSPSKWRCGRDLREAELDMLASSEGHLAKQLAAERNARWRLRV